MSIQSLTSQFKNIKAKLVGETVQEGDQILHPIAVLNNLMRKTNQELAEHGIDVEPIQLIDAVGMPVKKVYEALGKQDREMREKRKLLPEK